MAVITTEHLVLRRANLEDAEFILALLNEPAWLEYIGDRGVRTLEQARQYIRDHLLSAYARDGFGLWLVEHQVGAMPVGLCGLSRRDGFEAVDLGFALRPEFRGRGLAREAAEACLRYARFELGLSRVLAITTPDNDASVALLQRLGFQFVRGLPLSGEVLSVYAIELPAPVSGPFTS